MRSVDPRLIVARSGGRRAEPEMATSGSSRDRSGPRGVFTSGALFSGASWFEILAFEGLL